jgi:hypothetical protein
MASASATALFGPGPDSSICLAELFPFTSSLLAQSLASDVAPVIIVLNIRKVVIFAIKWLPQA